MCVYWIDGWSLSLSPNVYLSAQRFYITELVVADGTWEHLQSPSPMGGGNGARGHANQPTYPPNNRLTVHTAIHTYVHTYIVGIYTNSCFIVLEMQCGYIEHLW